MRVGRHQRDFSGYSMDIGLASPFFSGFDHRLRFVNGPPIVIDRSSTIRPSLTDTELDFTLNFIMEASQAGVLHLARQFAKLKLRLTSCDRPQTI
jgi:hypothetical protein